MELRPTKANLDQVIAGQNGEMVAITDDVQGIVNDLNQIDPHLRVRFSVAGDYFVIYWLPDSAEEGDGYLVTTAQELDKRIVSQVQEIYWKVQQPGYSYADELDKVQDEEKRKVEHEFTEQHGEIYEQLAHAMRKDLGTQNRVFVPSEVPNGDVR